MKRQTSLRPASRRMRRWEAPSLVWAPIHVGGFRRGAALTGGFTLLELLIAMVITTVLAGGIVSAFGTGLRVWERVQQQSDAHLENAAIGELLAGDLRSAWLSTDGTMGSFELPEDMGRDADATFSFTSLLPDKEHPQVSYLATVTYRLDPGTHTLWRTVAMVTPDETDAAETTPERGTSTALTFRSSTVTEEATEERVAEHVAAFVVRCWDGEHWQGTWTTDDAESSTLTLSESEEQTASLPRDLAGPEPAEQPDDAAAPATTAVLPKAVEVTVRFAAMASQPEHAVKTIVLIPMGQKL